MTDLREYEALRAQGVRRQPYYFTHGPRAVVCPTCADGLIARHGEATSLVAHYFTARPLMCGHCGVWIGPMADEEVSA